MSSELGVGRQPANSERLLLEFQFQYEHTRSALCNTSEDHTFSFARSCLVNRSSWLIVSGSCGRSLRPDILHARRSSIGAASPLSCFCLSREVPGR